MTPGVASLVRDDLRRLHRRRVHCSSKTRDGRPIKIEGNAESRLSAAAPAPRARRRCCRSTIRIGARTALARRARRRGPRSTPRSADGWRPRAARRVVLLSGTITSPSTRALIAEWSSRFPRFSHVVYDAISFSGAARGDAARFGIATRCRTTASIGRARSSASTPISSAPGCRRSSSRGSTRARRRRAVETLAAALPFRGRRVADRQQCRSAHSVPPSAHGATALALLRRIAGARRDRRRRR